MAHANVQDVRGFCPSSVPGITVVNVGGGGGRGLRCFCWVSDVSGTEGMPRDAAPCPWRTSAWFALFLLGFGRFGDGGDAP